MKLRNCISKNIKVMIVTQHAILGDGIKKILQNSKEITVLGSSAEVAEALSIIKDCKTDVMLIDLDMFKQEHMKFFNYLKTNQISVKILLLVDQFEEQTILGLLSSGIYGYLTKWTSSDDMIKAIKIVNDGEMWVGRQVISNLINRSLHVEICEERLSSREEEIAQFIAQGYRNKEIAAKLFICEKTVKCHVTNIFKKMGVNSRLKVALQLVSQIPQNIRK
ncbi:MAG: hypothetical protein A2X87_00945 [Deltaproteobacteria bacterium GWC2_42_51]|nr:MAG: hypothetical protein A2056_03960 [Deltaproteobacteria bacterium GWA2_42_85]OGP31566.1 MAG: hypothetical protein A2067_01325 [Deltaproteobacteria bacterium GWB2_42_7]OGP33052.1 MAG: hypothetical protein A2X87_00945 [Deltaproteobacteria bacterium GWC2_42_51]OGP42133.1 MAG: hypothetical protein A2090_02425 [Deltaproteobacteria bacterium GWD2_42_10]OGP48538.1 MAG: hypothetical protein A2022_08900 [Deltaproteobacteria bacterium GWF2_42_12]OGQ29343.1 MAG: hypothetical protein A3D29_03030 [De